MRSSSCIASVIAFGFAMFGHAAFSADRVRDYAEQCFKAIEIKESDIPRLMNCFDGELLDVTQFGRSVARDKCPAIGASEGCKLPGQCDHPAWLDDGTCYGNSYLTAFDAKSNSDVTVALLCRHKRKNTNQPRRFDDIAMILHNKKNGETCWFQSRLGEQVRLNGLRVPRPTEAIAALFWQKPSNTTAIQCIDCHDSGPFIVSPWINQAPSAAKLRDLKKSPYKNSTPPFNQWPEPRFISIGKHGLDDAGDKSCTHCHHIGVIAKSKRSIQEAGTCDQWIDIDKSLREQKRQLHSVDKRFMPPRSLSVPLMGKFGFDEWEDKYGDHIRTLKDCCRKFAKNPNYPGDSVCKRE